MTHVLKSAVAVMFVATGPVVAAETLSDCLTARVSERKAARAASDRRTRQITPACKDHLHGLHCLRRLVIAYPSLFYSPSCISFSKSKHCPLHRSVKTSGIIV